MIDTNYAIDEAFSPFPKISRWSREVIVTEKIDGTNAQVKISDDGLRVRAGSRTRWITPGDDNYGFAAWVAAHKDELLKLGPGQHFGEWWGAGIQRKYGLDEKRFSLFNVSRWGDETTRPSCCGVVPVLWRGNLDDMDMRSILIDLHYNGSRAAPRFMNAEGVVIFHVASGALFKKTIEKDAEPKGKPGRPGYRSGGPGSSIEDATTRKAYALLLDVVALDDLGIESVGLKFGYPQTAIELAKQVHAAAPSAREIPPFGSTAYNADVAAAWAPYFKACTEAGKMLAEGWKP